jgi:NAD(P)-dependent dehydrogenase (short-subunit alcohol dehydrogenase family)
VLLGARDPVKGAQAAAGLKRRGLKAVSVLLDVSEAASIDRARALIEANAESLDVLVNNAAIHYDTWQSATDANMTTVIEAWETNVLGPWRVTQMALPLLRRARAARIVNVSSESGSLASMSGGTPAYAVTKAALNALTRKFAADLKSEGILVNAVCPGWTATDMGGGGRPVAEGARGIVWAATLPPDGPTGGFFRDGRHLPW